MIKHIYPKDQAHNGVGLYGAYIDNLLPKVRQPQYEVQHFEIGYTDRDILWQAYRHSKRPGNSKYVVTLHDPPVIVGQLFGSYIRSQLLPFKAVRKALDLTFGKGIIRRVIRGASAIIVLNPLATEPLMQHFNMPRDRLFTSPLPVLTPIKALPEASGPLKLLFFGNVSERKGVTTLIEACSKLRPNSSEWTLDVTGKFDGNQVYEDQVKDLIKAEKLGNRVNLLGFVETEHLSRLIAQADIVILPYYDVGIIHASGPLTTSLAAGKAVIATDLPIFAADIKDEQTGLLFVPGDTAKLTQQLQRLIDDQDFRTKLGAAARKAIAETHNDDAIITSLNKVYASNED